jgi:hypothetical protein
MCRIGSNNQNRTGVVFSAGLGFLAVLLLSLLSFVGESAQLLAGFKNAVWISYEILKSVQMNYDTTLPLRVLCCIIRISVSCRFPWVYFHSPEIKEEVRVHGLRCPGQLLNKGWVRQTNNNNDDPDSTQAAASRMNYCQQTNNDNLPKQANLTRSCNPLFSILATLIKTCAFWTML